MGPRRVVIAGAAGRDFHVFNTAFRDDPAVHVVGFTATQIPGIEWRRYPAELAGAAYPHGIPIVPEEGLERLIRDERVQEVVFAYSDVSHETVMHVASRVLAAGADFSLLGPDRTMVPLSVPVVSVCAVRTGAGKSQTSRFLAGLLLARGMCPAIVRHPMPYGDLKLQRVQRFATLEDLDIHHTTVEEREDYEPHIRRGLVVFAGVDYDAVARTAELEADVVVWDGGNNDFPFFRSDLEITVVDPLRPGHETRYHPGEVNLRRADVVVINKVGSATPAALAAVREAIAAANPNAVVVEVDSRIFVTEAGFGGHGAPALPGVVAGAAGGTFAGDEFTGAELRGLRVLVIEDGPTLTHGGMATGAGAEAARLLGAGSVVDPRPHAVGYIAEIYERYPHLGPILPAVGYFEEQLRDLEATVEAVPADVVLCATPFDLAHVIRIDRRVLRVSYELAEREGPSLTDVVDRFLAAAPGRPGDRA